MGSRARSTTCHSQPLSTESQTSKTPPYTIISHASHHTATNTQHKILKKDHSIIPQKYDEKLFYIHTLYSILFSTHLSLSMQPMPFKNPSVPSLFCRSKLRNNVTSVSL